MDRPLNLNREYLEQCVDEGREVHVPGFGTFRRVDQLPSQDELDAVHTARTSRRGATPVTSAVAGSTPLTSGTGTTAKSRAAAAKAKAEADAEAEAAATKAKADADEKAKAEAKAKADTAAALAAKSKA